MAEDGTLTVPVGSGLLANDSDTEGAPLTAAKVTDPAHGTVTVGANGTYVYTPAANANGWSNTTVSVTWNWADEPGGSGVDPG